MSEEHRNAREELADTDSLPATQGQVNQLHMQIAELKTLLSKKEL
jgi:voltage-gated sodium channel